MATEAALALHKILTGLKTTIAAAESLSCGEVMTHLGSVPGSSDYFLGGLCAYNIHQKVEHLGVDAMHAVKVNCVSEKVAREMAAGIRNLMGSEIGVSTTGYAMPCPEQGVEEPFAWLGFNLFDTSFERKIVMDISVNGTPEDHRIDAQGDAGYAVLTILLEWFLGVRHGSVEIPENTRLLLESKGFFNMEIPEYDPENMTEYGYD